MEFNEVVSKRRSVRKYLDKEVKRSDIEEMIKAASLAPSWKNSQTARYYVVLSNDKLKEFKETCLPEFNANNVANAGALIVTTFVKDRAGFDKDGTPTNELGNMWGSYDLGLASENLCLKATELGLGTLIMGIRDNEKIKEFLNISDDEIVASVISVGYFDHEILQPKRKELDEIMKIF